MRQLQKGRCRGCQLKFRIKRPWTGSLRDSRAVSRLQEPSKRTFFSWMERGNTSTRSLRELWPIIKRKKPILWSCLKFIKSNLMLKDVTNKDGNGGVKPKLQRIPNCKHMLWLFRSSMLVLGLKISTMTSLSLKQRSDHLKGVWKTLMPVLLWFIKKHRVR